MRFIFRHAGFIHSFMIYTAISILLPEVDYWRLATATILICVAIMIAIEGWTGEYRDRP